MNNFSCFHVLVLDDDESIHTAVRQVAKKIGVTITCCYTAKEASAFLSDLTGHGRQEIFCIVDVFLLGGSGDEESRKFIVDSVIPRGLPYGRLTSAPSEVQPGLEGAWVVDKRAFYFDDAELLEPLQLSLIELQEKLQT